jgi:exodeoxyribonuclease III
LKIATYNVNGISARLPRLLEWLAETQPDIVCLQELKGDDAKFPAKALEAAGYGALWHGQKAFNGVAILARGNQPVERQRGLPGDPDDLHSRYLEAELNGLIIASLYLPNGNPVPGPKFDYKLGWFARLISHAAMLLASERPVILAGDYNVIPTDQPEDVFSPTAMAADALTQPGSRAAYRELLAQGWTDSLRSLYPTAKLYSFWDYQAAAWPRDAGFRIDHLLASPAAADRLCEAGVDREYRGRDKASDHTPVWLKLS